MSSKRSLDQENPSVGAKRSRPSAGSSSTPLGSSSSSAAANREPTSEEVHLTKKSGPSKSEKAMLKEIMERDRLAAKPVISRWDAPPSTSTPDPKKDRDREKARLKREKDKADKLANDRKKAQELAKGGKGMMAWVVRKPAQTPPPQPPATGDGNGKGPDTA